MSHMFISYSRKDSACVNAVVDNMTRNDFPVWIDTESIKITDEWLEKIESAINGAKVFLLFWSKNASESDYVGHELKIAKMRQVEGHLSILVVMLDDTELPTKHLQAYDMKHGCTPMSIANFINELKPEWKEFSWKKPLNAQTHVEVADGWVSVLFDSDRYCKAYIVGKPLETLTAAPANLAVCLQFFRSVNENMIPSVIASLPPNTWILHITGPTQYDKRTESTIYSLDNNDTAQWEACRAFIVRSIQAVGSQATTTLHFFSLTPNALLGGVTMPFNRFWHVKLFNFVPGSNGYVPVLDLPRF